MLDEEKDICISEPEIERCLHLPCLSLTWSIDLKLPRLIKTPSRNFIFSTSSMQRGLNPSFDFIILQLSNYSIYAYTYKVFKRNRIESKPFSHLKCIIAYCKVMKFKYDNKNKFTASDTLSAFESLKNFEGSTSNNEKASAFGVVEPLSNLLDASIFNA